MKEKLTSDIIGHGLWQLEAQVDSVLTTIRSETKKRESLKAKIRFRKVVLQQNTSDELLYRFSSKLKGTFSSAVLHGNLLTLISAAAAADTTEPAPSSLNGKKIKHQFQHKFEKYNGQIISQVPGFPEWFNVVYENEPDIVYSYNLTEDIANGDLEVL